MESKKSEKGFKGGDCGAFAGGEGLETGHVGHQVMF